MTEANEALNGFDLDVPGLVDVKLEEEGDWFDHKRIDGAEHLLLDENGNGFKRVKVRSRYTRDYQAAEAEFAQTLLRVPQSQREERQRDFRNELMGKVCIADWEFTDRSGTEIPYTPEVGAHIMSDPSFRNHRNFVQAAILILQGDLKETQEEDEKN